MKTAFSIITGFLIALLLTGCASGRYGRELDPSFVQQIERGKTTKAEIRRQLGEPLTVTTSPQGEMWRYSYSGGLAYWDMMAAGLTGSLDPASVKVQNLTIIFEGDLVKDFSFTAQGK